MILHEHTHTYIYKFADAANVIYTSFSRPIIASDFCGPKLICVSVFTNSLTKRVPYKSTAIKVVVLSGPKYVLTLVTVIRVCYFLISVCGV